MFNPDIYNFVIDSAALLQEYLDSCHEDEDREVEVRITANNTSIYVDEVEIWSEDFHAMENLEPNNLIELYEETFAIEDSIDDIF